MEDEFQARFEHLFSLNERLVRGGTIDAKTGRRALKAAIAAGMRSLRAADPCKDTRMLSRALFYRLHNKKKKSRRSFPATEKAILGSTQE
jgi:hypothetical protein